MFVKIVLKKLSWHLNFVNLFLRYDVQNDITVNVLYYYIAGISVYDENMVICLVCIVKNGALCLAFFSQLIQVVNIFHLLCCFDQKLH